MSEPNEDWNPMSDAYHSVVFNSYSTGQIGANLPIHLLPGGHELSGSKSRENIWLIIDGFPSDVTESGLKGYLKRIGCKPSAVKRVKNSQQFGQYYSFAEFLTTKEAINAIQLIRDQKLYRLKVGFASTEDDLRQKKRLIDSESERLMLRNSIMKQKIDIGNNVAINANNSHTNGKSFGESDTESHDSINLDVLSPLAKTDKLLKVLNSPEDDCSFCSGSGDAIDHLHFILNEQQVIDPKLLPALIDMNLKCRKCGKSSNDMKLCSQCQLAYYCDRKCQSNDWVGHQKMCKPVGAQSNGPKNKISSPVKVSSPTKQKTLATPPPVIQSMASDVTDSPVIIVDSPKVVFNKTSIDVPVVAEQLAKKLNFEDAEEEIEMKSYIDYKPNGTELKCIINERLDVDDNRYLATIFDTSIGRIITPLQEEYKDEKSYTPKVNDFIVGKQNDRYFRAYVLQVNDKSAKVFLIDDSNLTDIDLPSVYRMSGKFMKAPAFAALLAPVSRSAGLRIETLAEKEPPVLDGVYDKDNGLVICGDDSYKILPFNAFIDIVKKSVNTIGAKPKTTTENVDHITEHLTRRFEIKKTVDLMALYKDETDPKVFFVADEGDEFENMMGSCAELGSKFDSSIKVTPVVGKVYLVQSTADGEWYRGLVLAINDKLSVYYIDFGNKEEVEAKTVMDLTPEMSVTSVPPIALKCRVDKTKLSATELNKKVDKAVIGEFLLKLKILDVNNAVHSVELIQ